MLVLNGHDYPATPAAQETFGEVTQSHVLHEIAKLIRAVADANQNWR